MTPRLIPAYTTHLGRAYHGDALDVLRPLPADSVALVLTSPPFALRRQKAYGNVAAAEYVEWFWPFAQEIHRVLRPDGSFVLDLGGAWNRGSGTRSLFPYELVLRLGEIFHLAQEFYWYNPCRLPTPAEWVTIRRTRVKDAVNTLWWLSKTTEPQADNRRVLQPYSRSMKRLLEDGYEPAMRPSQHEIGPHFRRDNGGAIPPNLLDIPNTRSERRLPAPLPRGRPADPPGPLPARLPEFFIRFLTRAGADRPRPVRRQQRHRRRWRRGSSARWISVEINADYVAGSIAPLPRRRRYGFAARERSRLRWRAKRSSR